MHSSRDPRIDTYIDRSAAFDQPILRHLRELVHRACPKVEETIKWSMPFFVQDGLLCCMAAFKAHAVFGFRSHHEAAILGADRAKAATAMGSLGRITKLVDLPPDNTLVSYIRHAAELNASNTSVRGKPKKTKPAAVVVPTDLKSALQKDKAAAKAFAVSSPSHRREYIQWITEAKRPETRSKRLATTVEWLSEGKSRNWKYEAR